MSCATICAVAAVLCLAPWVWAEYIPPGPAFQCPKKKALLFPCVCTASGDRGIRVLCENSNLASLSVGLKNLAEEKLQVEELTISRCDIARLFGNLLHKLKVRVLRVLDTPVKVIEPHFFLNVNRTLQNVHFINTHLRAFPAEAFQILGNVSLLELDQHRISELDTKAFSEGFMKNVLERLRVTHGNLTALPADAFAGLKKLKTLDLHGNQISQLKKNQFKGLRDLEVLDLSHNNLTKLDSSHVADLTKLGWCNASNNAIKELTRGTFARNTVLKYLNLNHNQIKRLDSNSFRGMRFIRRLLFSDNQISEIGRGTFNSVTRIGTIDLARNLLKKIDYQMFFQLNYVEKIDVSGNQVTEIQKLAFKDLYLVSINVSHNSISKIEAGAFENCANITELDMSHNLIDNIPNTAFDSTTYATYLQLSFNNLTSLGQVPMQNMTGLKVLNVSNNLLRIIPRHTFPKLYELHTIDLSHNQIKDIYNGVFQVLFSLRSLNLSHNSLEEIKSSMFGALPTLLELDLSNNGLREMSRGALARLASLRKLDMRNNLLERIFQIPISLSDLILSNNKLESIPSSGEPWPTMNSLLMLDLSRNHLQDSLSKGSFAGLLTLRILNLSYNGIGKAPREALSDLTSLQYLELEGNNLTELSKGAFGRLPVVFELNLSNCSLYNISERSFDGLLQLLTLNLSSNSLKHIPNGAFQSLVSLRTLDLSHNRLEKLDNKTHGLLDDLLSLETVNISHNKVAFVTRKIFPSSPYIPYKLRHVDLSYNAMPVITNDFVYGTGRVEYLNVSHNMINEIRKGVLGNLTALKVLDLSFNQLTELTRPHFGPPKNLTELYLSHNQLRQLPLEPLNELKSQIQMLDVRHNHLAEVHHELIPLLENGTNIRFEGNPLECNCLMRPVNRWLGHQLDVPAAWADVRCYGPGYLEGQLLYNLTQDRLTCPVNIRPAGDKFEPTPDVKFRQIEKLKRGGISLQWLVTSKADVADFYLTIREKTNPKGGDPAILLEKLLSYSDRKTQITKQETPAKRDNLELCLVALDSEGNMRDWQEGQCRTMSGLGSSAEQRMAQAQAWLLPLLLYIFMYMW